MCGAFQIFIICDPNDWSNNVACYVGQHEPEFEEQVRQELLLLKGAQILEAIGTQPVSTATFIHAVHVLNRQAHKALVERIKRTTVVAADPHSQFASPLFCEDSRLSLPGPGVRFDVLKFEDPHIPTLTQTELRGVIDVAASFMDFSKQESDGKSPAFMKALQMLTSRMTSVNNQEVVRKALLGTF